MTIHTIGHTNLDVLAFIDILKKAEIDYLVDIRSVPQSRFCPQFNKARIEAVLIENGISYAHEGASLGGRISDLDCYVHKKVPEKKTDFAKSIDYEILKTRPWFEAGIRRVIELAQGHKVVLMCMEEDPAKCHRTILVGRRLQDLGVELVHLRSKKA